MKCMDEVCLLRNGEGAGKAATLYSQWIPVGAAAPACSLAVLVERGVPPRRPSVCCGVRLPHVPHRPQLLSVECGGCCCPCLGYGSARGPVALGPARRLPA
ncbi:hypothetical protein NHX12_003552 [Muraenolepis orangiensis]|uniref:Uncharacterized protein n=1 Tax=Muraenolepis orangiensis TaxID=630683 RepID=A0A9Q0E317_9TELE|nr:hypothetical protein NHX12_003552 [Muraenolepis orangiensis]